MLSHKDPDKAQRYLIFLDEARCSGNWEEVSRLRLKIAKHVPQRKCLQITVATDYTLSTRPSDRPSTSSSITPFDYGQRVPDIVTALKYGNPTAEDTFQAEICLAWLHWIIKEPSLALSRIPTDLKQISDRLTSEGGELTGWTHVCIAKGAYIRGICLESAGNLEEAVQTYESMLPYISKAHSSFGNTSEHRRWTQGLIARHCLLSSRYVKSKARHPHELLSSSSFIKPIFLLAPFRAWAEFWDVKCDRDLRILNDASNRGDVSRKNIWLAYYDTLSILLRIEHTYPSVPAVHGPSGNSHPKLGTEFFSGPKSQHCAELKRVESIYEGFLLNELSFPKANEHTPEIEAWVDQVVTNWKFVCGPGWLDEDHADGGKAGASRRVLAILYQATTRSFHSPRILRYLFTVHMSLADFHLAGKALDTYFEIVKKGKARVEKSGVKERSLDDDETAIWTAAAGIKMLCFYGRRKEAERAKELAAILEKWLQPHYDNLLSSDEYNTEESLNDALRTSAPARSLVHNEALAAGFCALGISQAHWASLTYETSTRSDLQTIAIENLRIASRVSSEDVEILYHLALSLSKARDLEGAIAVIKRALSNNTDETVVRENDSENGAGHDTVPDCHKRRFLVKCWHLLALLLSAKHNFSTAATSCEAALELFGIQSISGSLKKRGLVTNVALVDRQSIIELKMTQIALAEVEHGPEEAVNSAGELLSLYAKLFHYTEESAPKHTTPATISPPASRNGTIKSLGGSFLSRSKNTSTKASGPGPTRGNIRPSSVSSRESPNAVTRTPTISVTADDNVNTQGTSRYSHHVFHHEPKKLHKRNSTKSVSGDRRSRASSPSRVSTANSLAPNFPLSIRQAQNEEKAQNEEEPNTLEYSSHLDFPSDEVGIAISHDLPSFPSSPPATHTFQSTSPPQQSKHPIHLSQPIDTNQSTTLASSSVHSLPNFPPSLQTRHALTLLAKIWLLISSAYRRANMPTDAQGALSEASKQVTAIESAVANTHSSAEAFSAPDWGRLKSVAELWADVLAEKGRLYLKLGDRDAAEEAFEVALGWFEDHPGAIVGLAGILLDTYAQPSSPPSTTPFPSPPTPTPVLASLPVPPPASTSFHPASANNTNGGQDADGNLLLRLAARDRAYGMLSSLTKSGRGWDDAEAWFALARAYEETSQLARAKEALWWVVELAEGKGIRGWECVDGW